MQSNLTSGKYEGGELVWACNKPLIIIACQARPIIDKDSAGNLLNVPICHLSAHRLIGNVFSMKMGPSGLELVQDKYCDELAIRVREDEERRHAIMIKQCETGKVLTDSQAST